MLTAYELTCISLVLETGSAILRITMTDTFYYQDVFQNINIPKKERRLAIKAKELLDVAHAVSGWKPKINKHLLQTFDTKEISQAFWSRETEIEYDRFVISVMGKGLRLAVEHRRLETSSVATRSSIHIENGVSKVYFSDLQNLSRIGVPETSEEAIGLFKWQFADTIATLGLHHHIEALHQNESNAAVLPNAA